MLDLGGGWRRGDYSSRAELERRGRTLTESIERVKWMVLRVSSMLDGASGCEQGRANKVQPRTTHTKYSVPIGVSESMRRRSFRGGWTYHSGVKPPRTYHLKRMSKTAPFVEVHAGYAKEYEVCGDQTRPKADFQWASGYIERQGAPRCMRKRTKLQTYHE